MINTALAELELTQQTIITLAQEEGIKVEFGEGRRKNDILLMSLHTEKNNALQFYLKLSNKFPKHLIHVFRLKDPEKRGLTAALIESPMERLKETDPFFEERRRNFFANEKSLGNWEKFLQEKN